MAASMRPRASQAQTFLTALAGAHVHGVSVDWSGFEGLGAGRVELPAYAFQRRRYWLGAGAGVGDPAAAGQSSVEHPLLGRLCHWPAMVAVGCSRGGCRWMRFPGSPITLLWTRCCFPALVLSIWC